MPKFFNKKEYQIIADQFRLGKILGLKYFKQGFAAPKAAIRTKHGTYVISKQLLGRGDNFTNKTPRSLQAEIDLLNGLKKLPVPQYVADKRGRHIFLYKGFGVTIYKYLPGLSVKFINQKRAYNLGCFLGNFHAQGLRLKNKFNGRNKLYEFARLRLEEMRAVIYRQKNNRLSKVAGEIEKGLINSSPPKGLPEGPIHVDFKPDNFLFKGNRLVGVLDFGNFYIGPLMIDLGKAIIFNCTKNKKLDRKLVDSFLRGYEKFRQLTKQERAYFKKAVHYGIYSHVWLDLYHVPLKLVPAYHPLNYIKIYLPAVKDRI